MPLFQSNKIHRRNEKPNLQSITIATAKRDTRVISNPALTLLRPNLPWLAFPTAPSSPKEWAWFQLQVAWKKNPRISIAELEQSKRKRSSFRRWTAVEAPPSLKGSWRCVSSVSAMEDLLPLPPPKWLHANGCAWGDHVTARAVSSGNFEMLKCGWWRSVKYESASCFDLVGGQWIRLDRWAFAVVERNDVRG